MKKRLMLLILPIIAIILESLPNGVVLNFSVAGGTATKKVYFSYFDTTPYGYASFSPLLTAVLTCLILLLLIIYCFINKRSLLSAIKILLNIRIALSLCKLIFGLTTVGIFVTLTMIAEAVIIHFIKE
ncbi:MAG: hypothetical protein E7513_00330 [Ruminococcaceae bacterium]|nr:hypothetical protein [Oscillospiraceae bacterium]